MAVRSKREECRRCSVAEMIGWGKGALLRLCSAALRRAGRDVVVTMCISVTLSSNMLVPMDFHTPSTRAWNSRDAPCQDADRQRPTSTYLLEGGIIKISSCNAPTGRPKVFLSSMDRGRRRMEDVSVVGAWATNAFQPRAARYLIRTMVITEPVSSPSYTNCLNCRHGKHSCPVWHRLQVFPWRAALRYWLQHHSPHSDISSACFCSNQHPG
jgi:hypothetical protein